MTKQLRMILIGPPGAGKGTQALRLRDKYGVPHVSAGDLFRARVKDPNDPLGQEIKAILDSGKLVPDEITIKMIAERLDKDDAKNGFILDGFPRSLAQAKALDDMLKSKGIVLDAVVQMEVDDDKLVERITGRFTCSCCNEGYHDKFKPLKKADTCDSCGAVETPENKVFTRRSDDNEVAVRARLKTYYEQTEPLLPFYEGKGALRRVNGMASMDEVTQQIESVLCKGKGGCDIQSKPKSCG